MVDRDLDRLMREVAAEMVNSSLDANASKRQTRPPLKVNLTLRNDVEVHPLWWALDGEPNPKLRLAA